jgi:hypothetical protein
MIDEMMPFRKSLIAERALGTVTLVCFHGRVCQSEKKDSIIIPNQPNTKTNRK